MFWCFVFPVFKMCFLICLCFIGSISFKCHSFFVSIHEDFFRCLCFIKLHCMELTLLLYWQMQYTRLQIKASQNHWHLRHTSSSSSATDFLREDTMIGTSFLRVAAHDDDFGTNAAIMYSMSSEQPEYLRVNPMTGWVYVNQPISQVHTDYIQSDITKTFSSI